MNVRLCWTGVVFLAVGLIGYGGLQLAVVRVNETAAWPSVTGRIVTSETGTAVMKTGPVRRVVDTADVCYAYFVNGQRYECDRLRVIPMLHSSEGTPEEILARYPIGLRVAVYYDPEDPADALLLPEPTEQARSLIRSLTFLSIFLGFLGPLFVVIGAMHLRTGARAEQCAAIEARRVESAPAPAAVSSVLAAAVPPRPTHWLFRLAATLLGLFLLLMGSLLAMTAARTFHFEARPAVEITCLVLFAGMALGGGYLVTRGTRRPSAG